jgi:nicotinamidase-related amidase
MTVAETGAAPGTRVTGTTPYPWPWDGDLTPSATTLLVVAEAGSGAPAGYRAPLERERITALATALRAAGGRVVAATTRRPARAGELRPGSTGPVPAWTALLDADLVDDAVVAHGLDAHHGSDLELVLSTTGTRRLLLAGAQLEVSVHSTMRTANDRGLECLLVADACLSGDPDLAGAAVSMVEMSGGIFGAVGSTAAVLAALAGTPYTTPDP